MYSLAHSILNDSLPPAKMWMNMGYWKDQIDDPNDFVAACENLLAHVLCTALQPNQAAQEKQDIRLLDVGFGCGDQTLCLLDTQWMARLGLPTVKSYVGITQAPQQHAYACMRVPTNQHKRLFCANAAIPDQWPTELESALRRNFRQRQDQTTASWMLGLDSMLHLSPSRVPLLSCACNELGASFMAFDLVRAEHEESPPLLQRLLLRVVCAITSIPYTNLMPEERYREMLISAGYPPEGIEMHDISDFVFNPLHTFMDRQQTQLRALGRGGLGLLRIPKWIFGWFGKTGVVRGYIIVARSSRHMQSQTREKPSQEL